MFYAHSEEEKEEWVNAIANYLQKTKENIGSFSVRQRKKKPVRLGVFLFLFYFVYYLPTYYTSYSFYTYSFISPG